MDLASARLGDLSVRCGRDPSAERRFSIDPGVESSPELLGPVLARGEYHPAAIYQRVLELLRL